MNKHFEGDLIAKAGEVYEYVSVGGSIDASGADTRTAFPKLATVGGSINARGADTRTAFQKLATVGGSIDASGADTRTAFPKLATVGGSIDARGAWGHIEQNNPASSYKMLLKSFAKYGYTFADNILAKVVSVKGRVSRVLIAGKTKVSYLVTDGEAWSHGDTLQKARESLMFKISSRDTTEYKKWKLDTKVTLAQAIKSYRAITGACEQGVKLWMENKKVPEAMTIAQAIELTRGAYGNEAYKEFFKSETK